MSQTILTQSVKPSLPVSIPTATETVRLINVSDCIPDIAANVIHDSEHFQLPSDIIENTIFLALNELVDDFANNPDKYMKPHHETQIDTIAEEYRNS